MILRTPTFEAPDELGAPIRFYARELPEQPSLTAGGLLLPVRKLVGLSADGQVVACLLAPEREEGTPLSSCQ